MTRPPASRAIPSVLLGALLALATSARAEDEVPPPLGPGDTLAPVALEDQHGTERRVDATTRVVAFTRDMDAGGVLREALEALRADGEWLAARGIVVVADIEGMPGLVTRLFALPAMRRRAYPMLLDREGRATRRWPTAEGRVTLLFLDGLRIERVAMIPEREPLRAEILGLPTSDEAEAGDAPAVEGAPPAEP